MSNAATQKARLRKEALTRRNGLDEETRIDMSLRASEAGLAAPCFDEQSFMPGTIVAGFHPIRSEIDPRPLMAALAARGARLCLPVVLDGETIEFRELLRGAPLVAGGFGTVGPDENAAVLSPQIILLPMSVYDSAGGRIGYGAGYYDRAIEKLRMGGVHPTLVGMAFSLQEAATVPMEPHDKRLDGIITETGYQPARS